MRLRPLDAVVFLVAVLALVLVGYVAWKLT